MAFTQVCAASAAPSPTPVEPTTIDRPTIQRLIGKLQISATAFGLKERHLTLLDALASFMRNLTGDGRPIVFASNKALSARCHGKSIPSIKRIATELVAMGLLTRHSSPNGKRFARYNAAKDIVAAYGFDLTPLVAVAGAVEAEATRREELLLQTCLLRDQVSNLRHSFTRGSTEHNLVLSTLRRKTASADDLEAVYEALSAHLAPASTDCLLMPVGSEVEISVDPCEAAAPFQVENVVLTPNVVQIDTHHQSSIQNKIESKRQDSHDDQSAATTVGKEAVAKITVQELCEACPGAIQYAEESPRSWPDLWRLASTLAPMIGIKEPLAVRAAHYLGSKGFTIALLCLVERFAVIKNPSGYLASLIRPENSYLPVRHLRSMGAGRSQALVCAT